MTGGMEHYWIECTTAMPEDNEPVWITFDDDKGRHVGFARWHADKQRFIGWYFPYKNVVAWMRQPQPFGVSA